MVDHIGYKMTSKSKIWWLVYYEYIIQVNHVISLVINVLALTVISILN